MPFWMKQRSDAAYTELAQSTTQPSRTPAAIPRIINAVVVPFFSVALILTVVLSITRPSQGDKPSLYLPEPIQLDIANSTLGDALPRHLQEDLSLSAEVCKREFPLFYYQLDANAYTWQTRGGLKQSHVERAWLKCEGGCARVIVSDGRVYIRSLTHDWQSRVRAVLALLRQAVESAPPSERAALEGTEFVFSTADKDGTREDDGAGWVLDKRVTDPPRQYLIPDFSFAAWPEAGIASYEEFRRDAAEVNANWPWLDKKNRLFWRGDPTVGNAARKNLMQQITGSSRSTWSWADVQQTSFWEPHFAKIVLPADHCEHKYLLHSEGNSYSGRSKFILGCASAVVMHKLEWTQHFHPALVTGADHIDRNVIENPGHLFEGLGDLIQSLQRSDKETAMSSFGQSSRQMSIGEQVAANANRTLTQRYLTPAATACYFRAAMASYNSVLDRSSWSANRGYQQKQPAGPHLIKGGGVKPGAGAGQNKGSNLKNLNLEGDIELTTWELLGQPEWPVK